MLPLPALPGPHQLQNAGNAIAVLRCLQDQRISDDHIANGLKSVQWPGRLQRLRHGGLSRLLDEGSELWLDGGHNADAGIVLAKALQAMPEKPLVIIWGMLNTKDARDFFRPLATLAKHVVTLNIPDEANATPAESLAETVRGLNVSATPASGVRDAVLKACAIGGSTRILICGSLYLAGHVLAAEESQSMSAISGTAKK